MLPLNAQDVHPKVEALILPLLARAGVDLVELYVGRHGRGMHVRVTADRPRGGITIKECVRLNRAVIKVLDADGVLGQDYGLEFSSPGLDRPLKDRKDFARHLNGKIYFWLKESVGGKKEFAGILIAVDAKVLTVAINGKNTIALPLACIEQGRVVI